MDKNQDYLTMELSFDDTGERVRDNSTVACTSTKNFYAHIDMENSNEISTPLPEYDPIDPIEEPDKDFTVTEYFCTISNMKTDTIVWEGYINPHIVRATLHIMEHGLQPEDAINAVKL